MARRKGLAVLGAILALMLVTAACKQQQPAGGGGGQPKFTTLKEGVLSVGSCLDYRPFEYREKGELKGFDVELTEHIAEHLGIRVEWVKANFNTIFPAVAADDFDMVAAASTITDEREQVVDFSDPYYNARQALTINSEKTPDVASTDDLQSGDVVGVQKGTTGKDWAEENLAPNGIEIKSYQTAPQAFNDLETGDVVGVINDEPSSEAEVEERPGLEVVEGIDTGEHYGFAFSPNNPELREAVNGALQEAIDEGDYEAIFATYFPGVEVPPEYSGSA